MDLRYMENGYLQPGIYLLTIEELKKAFAYNFRRQELFVGFELAARDLQSCGCKRIYMNGSYITKKLMPSDYDACWDLDGVNLLQLKLRFPIFFKFENRRAAQKSYYKGELFPASLPAQIVPTTITYLRFFQLDKEDNSKGIIAIPL